MKRRCFIVILFWVGIALAEPLYWIQHADRITFQGVAYTFITLAPGNAFHWASMVAHDEDWATIKDPYRAQINTRLAMDMAEEAGKFYLGSLLSFYADKPETLDFIHDVVSKRCSAKGILDGKTTLVVVYAARRLKGNRLPREALGKVVGTMGVSWLDSPTGRLKLERENNILIPREDFELTPPKGIPATDFISKEPIEMSYFAISPLMRHDIAGLLGTYTYHFGNLKETQESWRQFRRYQYRTRTSKQIFVNSDDLLLEYYLTGGFSIDTRFSTRFGKILSSTPENAMDHWMRHYMTREGKRASSEKLLKQGQFHEINESIQLQIRRIMSELPGMRDLFTPGFLFDRIAPATEVPLDLENLESVADHIAAIQTKSPKKSCVHLLGEEQNEETIRPGHPGMPYWLFDYERRLRTLNSMDSS